MDPTQQAVPAPSRQVKSLFRHRHTGALPAHAGALPPCTAPIPMVGLSLRDAAHGQPPTGAGRARERRCEGRAGSGHGHSLRRDVEADIPVLPQHVQCPAHGRHSPRRVRAPPWQRRGGEGGWCLALPRRPGLAAAPHAGSARAVAPPWLLPRLG